MINDIKKIVAVARDVGARVLLDGAQSVPHMPVNVRELGVDFLYVEGEALTVELSLRGVYVSSRSACTSRVLEPSHVLLAIGRKYEEAHGSVLFKLSRYHTREDIEYVLDHIPEAVEKLRKISPLKRTPAKEDVQLGGCHC